MRGTFRRLRQPFVERPTLFPDAQHFEGHLFSYRGTGHLRRALVRKRLTKLSRHRPGGRTRRAPGEQRDAMELQVAKALSFRLAQQEQWQQAEAVRDGRQPRVDPDGLDLEEFDELIRIYRLREVDGLMDGRHARVSQRLVKRLAASGAWEDDRVVDSYRHAEGHPVIATG